MNLIDKAGELNFQSKEISKELEKCKAEIKGNGVGSFEGDKWVATVSQTVGKKKLNQVRALEVVKKLGAKWLLSEIVDEEKLEDAIASGEIDAKEFVDCIDTSYVTKITFKARKGK